MNMKRMVLVALLAVSLTAIMSCSGSGNSGGGSGHAPVINGLWISPQSARINDGGGQISVTVGFDFSDSAADLGSYYLTAYDTNTGLATMTKQATLTPGSTAGSIQFTISSVQTTAAASYRFEVYITRL